MTVKLKGILVGALVIQSANILRLIALFYLGQWNATWFEWVHVYVGEIVIMILGLAFFGLWIRQKPALAKPPIQPNKHHQRRGIGSHPT